jgi:hypothetical protein
MGSFIACHQVCIVGLVYQCVSILALYYATVKLRDTTLA